MHYLKAMPSKIQNFHTKQLGGNFVNVYGSSGWHLVTIEQIKEIQDGIQDGCPYMAKYRNYYANIYVLAYLTPEISAINTLKVLHLR